MIIRSFGRRQGRALWRTRAPQSFLTRRLYASEIESPSTGSALEQNQLERQALEALLQTSSEQPKSSPTGGLDSETSSIVHKYRILEHQNRTIGKYGTVVPKHHNPDDILRNPPRPSDLTPELLLASQTHLGHSTSLWNPMNSRYIYGIRDGTHIISLEETLAHLRRACRIVEGVAERAGLILFVGTAKSQELSIVNAAKLAGGYHVFEKWIPGTITNGTQILGAARKKVVDMNDNEITVNEESLASMASMRPDLVICLNPLDNWVLLNECAQVSIPTIGIIDTDADPTCVTYPIPANDDSIRCTNLIAGVLGRAGQAGQATRKKLAAEGRVLYDAFKLPPDVAVGQRYMTELKDEGVPVEYRDEEGNLLPQDEVERMHREGVIVDQSLMKIYNDEDGGELTATEVWSYSEDGTVSEITTRQGGAAGGDNVGDINSGSSGSSDSLLSSLDATQARIADVATEVASVGNLGAETLSATGSSESNLSSIDEALARAEALEHDALGLSHEHSEIQLDGIEQVTADLRTELTDMSLSQQESEIHAMFRELEDLNASSSGPNESPVQAEAPAADEETDSNVDDTPMPKPSEGQ